MKTSRAQRARSLRGVRRPYPLRIVITLKGGVGKDATSALQEIDRHFGWLLQGVDPQDLRSWAEPKPVVIRIDLPPHHR